MLIEAAKNHLRIVEVEITVRYDVDTSTDNPVVQGFSVLMRVLELMRFNRPLYSYGISGAIILFFGILILLTINMTAYNNNIYLMSIGLFIVIMGIVLFISGIITDTMARYKK